MKSQFINLITVFPVKDMETSLAWYRRWLGEPDSIPMEGIAEYQVTETAWLQLTQEEGKSSQPYPECRRYQQSTRRSCQ